MSTELLLPKLERQETVLYLSTPHPDVSATSTTTIGSTTVNTGTVSISIVNDGTGPTSSVPVSPVPVVPFSPAHQEIISKIVNVLQEEMKTLHLDNSTILTYIIKIVQLVNGESTISPDEKKKIILEIIDELIDLSPLDAVSKALLKELVVLLYPAINAMIDHLASGALVLLKKVIVLAEEGIEEVEDDVESWCEKYCGIHLSNHCTIC